jgi:hypothetical protein
LLQAIPQLPEIVKAYYEQFQDFNEEENAKALSQLLTELTLTLLPIPKLSVGQISGLAKKLNKAADKVVKKAANFEEVAVKHGFKIEGQLSKIFADKKLFSNWLKGNQSLSRVAKPLNAIEAQQIIKNAQKLGIAVESNLQGLQGL